MASRILVLLVPLAIVCSACGSSSVDVVTVPTHANGLIAYVPEQGDIWLVGEHGRGRRQLTHFDGRETALGAGGISWAPDGKRIVATVAEGLIVIDLRGRIVERIPNARLTSHFPGGAAGAWEPAWSPTGASIALGTGLGGAGEIDVLRLRDGSVHTVVPVQSRFEGFGVTPHHPSWDPAGRDLYYAKSGAIYRFDPESSLTSRVVVDGDAPAASPDGTSVAFLRGGRLMLMDADGHHVRPVAGGGGTRFAQPSWSPDGTMLLAVRDAGGSVEDVALRPDGSDVRVLYDRASDDDALAWQPVATAAS